MAKLRRVPRPKHATTKRRRATSLAGQDPVSRSVKRLKKVWGK